MCLPWPVHLSVSIHRGILTEEKVWTLSLQAEVWEAGALACLTNTVIPVSEPDPPAHL